MNNPFKEKKGRKKIFNNNDMNVSILSLYIFFYYNIITNVN